MLVLIVLPINNRQRFQELKLDCLSHGLWVHDRIYENERPIDVLVLGSSHTINGIDEKHMEKKMANGLNVASLGYCRLGRNLSYTLLKKTLEAKQPRIVVLEVREDEDRYSHPIFPHIAGTGDVLAANLIFNRDYFDDVATHFMYKTELMQDRLYGQFPDSSVKASDYGYLYLDGNADIHMLRDMKKRENVLKSDLSPVERNFHMQYPRRYLKKIKRLCAKNDIALYFLYMPSYDSRRSVPIEAETYRELGTLLVPPMEIYENQLYWYDKSHLNIPGAKAVSEWLADELR
jgi:hypothetical protein